MLTPTEAARLILEHIAPLPAARRPLRETLDRVLAEDVKSPIDLPAWDNPAMDGYAARAVDVESAAPDHAVALAVIEAVAAGQFPTKPIGSGQVTRIFTGAPLPTGADAVVRQEAPGPAESGGIRVVTGRDARKNVRYRGEDIRKGDVVLGAGTPLGPAQLGVLASIAHATPLVHDAPRVAFMGSGDEIVDLDHADDILSGKKVATSNSYTLHALIKQNGGIPVDLGLARDTKENLRDHLAPARPGLTGGTAASPSHWRPACCASAPASTRCPLRRCSITASLASWPISWWSRWPSPACPSSGTRTPSSSSWRPRTRSRTC